MSKFITLGAMGAEKLQKQKCKEFCGTPCKKDFEGLYSDILCPLKCGKDDKLENVLTCPVLLSNHTSDNLSSSDIRHEDIFSSDIVKQKQATELYRQLLEVRTNLMNTQPVDRTGPVHRT